MSTPSAGPCAQFAGETKPTLSPLRVIVIVFVLGFEGWMLNQGHDVLTTLVVTALGVLIAVAPGEALTRVRAAAALLSPAA
ncbi:hypothetical protein L6E12_26960 [Actinokineospora sp. PR83]|uniref:hypothetical protein n=1 Tax=Actinokineospora sp. PR83 TaxID=2884908 RepID=UPI001F1E0BDE|nr:hypothetical protein [Actinokineospora sp. PR83]MCG8919421.1 hypothetical protein [Actinokineospora sp. PR83]